MQETQPVDVTNSESQAVNTAARLIVRQSKLDEVAREADTAQKPRPERMVLLTSHQHLEAVTVRCICNHSEEEGDIVSTLQSNDSDDANKIRSNVDIARFFSTFIVMATPERMTRDFLLSISAIRAFLLARMTPYTKFNNRLTFDALFTSCKRGPSRTANRSARHLVRSQRLSFNSKTLTPLGCSDKTVAMVKKELNKSGLLNTNLGPNRKDKIRLVFSSSPTAREVMERKFFNPISGIAHYASVRITSSWIPITCMPFRR
jgi:hypothetical protein